MKKQGKIKDIDIFWRELAWIGVIFKQIIFLFFSIISKPMEIRGHIADNESEISQMKLDCSISKDPKDDGGFLNKDNFLKHLLQLHLVDQPRSPNEQNNSNQESDQGFLKELLQIIEKHESEPDKNQHKKPLEDETCQLIHQICMRHRQASKFNIYSDYEPSQIPPDVMCKCGCGRAEGEPLSLCTDELQHYFFGPTILIFFYIRKMVGLLVFVAIMYGIFSVITNSMQAPELTNQCAKPGTFFFLCPLKQQVTTLNKTKNFSMMQIQLWLGFVMCVIWMIGARVIKSMGRIMNKKIDSFLDSSSDYVIQLNNLPEGKYTENQLIKFICSVWRSTKGKNVKLPKIKSVQIVYKMDESRKMIKDIIGNARKLAEHLSKRKVDEENSVYEIKPGSQEKYANCKNELIKSMIKIDEYRENFINNEEFRQSLTSEMAFIEYYDSNDQGELLNEIKHQRSTMFGDLKQYIKSKMSNNDQESIYKFKGKNIQIMRAPEPSDINWSNCEKKNSYRKVAVVWLLALIMVGISFAFLSFIRFLRTEVKFFADVSIISLISLQAFNRIIWNTLISVVSYQQNNTKTDNIISSMSKGAFAQAVNVLVNPLIFNYVIKVNLLGPEGAIASSLDYHFTFLIMQTFLTLFNLPYQMARLTIHIPFIRNYIIRKYSNVVGVVDTAEQIKQVLAYYQTPSFNIASAYTSTNTIIFHTMFYLNIQPFLIFTLIFNLCFVYFMHKYLLLRRYKIPQLVDFIIFQNSLSYVQHVPLIYGVGSFIWMYLIDPTNPIQNHYYIPILMCILLWLFCMINPCLVMDTITKKLVGIFGYTEDHDIQEKTVDVSAENVETPEEQRVWKRRECYYNGCGTTDLLEYEARLTQILRGDEYENLNKLFCQRFNFNPDRKTNISPKQDLEKPSNKKNSLKMLSKMKENYAVVRRNESRIQQTPLKIPLDMFNMMAMARVQSVGSSDSGGSMKKQSKLFDRKNNKIHALDSESPKMDTGDRIISIKGV